METLTTMKRLLASLALSLLFSTVAIAQPSPTPIIPPPDDGSGGSGGTGGTTTQPNLTFHGGSVVQTWDYPPALRPWSHDGNLHPGDPLNIRLYAGQPDPNDAAHFTIPYEIGDKKGVLDGFLKSNDKVELQARDVQQPG